MKSARTPKDTSAGTRANYTAPARLPHDWRDRLPAPANYYAQHVTNLGKPNGTGWSQGRCPFHDDNEASLSVNLQHGGWRCFAGCGKGDMVSFHERMTSQSFKRAVCDLLGAGHD